MGSWFVNCIPMDPSGSALTGDFANAVYHCPVRTADGARVPFDQASRFMRPCLPGKSECFTNFTIMPSLTLRTEGQSSWTEHLTCTCMQSRVVVCSCYALPYICHTYTDEHKHSTVYACKCTYRKRSVPSWVLQNVAGVVYRTDLQLWHAHNVVKDLQRQADSFPYDSLAHFALCSLLTK